MRNKENNEEQAFKESINKAVDRFKSDTEIILELSRIGFYQAELTAKLWHIHDSKRQEGKVKKRNSRVKKRPLSEQEAVSDYKK